MIWASSSERRGAHGELATVLHGVAGVEREVEHDALHAQLGDGHVGTLGVGRQLHLDRRRQQRVEQPAHGRDAGVEVDRDERVGGVVAVELVDEVEDGRGDDDAVGDVLADRVLRRETSQRQLGVAAHGGEQVAHVVGDRSEGVGAGLHAMSIARTDPMTLAYSTHGIPRATSTPCSSARSAARKRGACAAGCWAAPTCCPTSSSSARPAAARPTCWASSTRTPTCSRGPAETHFFDTHRYTYGLGWYRLRFPANKARRERLRRRPASGADRRIEPLVPVPPQRACSRRPRVSRGQTAGAAARPGPARRLPLGLVPAAVRRDALVPRGGGGRDRPAG